MDARAWQALEARLAEVEAATGTRAAASGKSLSQEVAEMQQTLKQVSDFSAVSDFLQQSALAMLVGGLCAEMCVCVCVCVCVCG